MKQNPSRLKFKKNHKPSFSSLYLYEKKNFFSIKGQLVLRALENGKLTYNQIEACRKSIRRMLNKKCIINLKVFTNISLTKKPLGSRMGKGKGTHTFWICIIKKGQIICEILYNTSYKLNLNKKLLGIACNKIPLKTKVDVNYF